MFIKGGNLRAVIISVLLLLLLGAGPAFSRAQGDSLNELLDKMTARVKSYPEVKNWRATVVSVITAVDKNWKPKKITRIKKTVNMNGLERREEILEASETEKGVTRDITQKFIHGAEKERQDGKEDSGMQHSMTSDDLLPFGEKNRSQYSFTIIEDSEADGRPIYVLECRAKVKNEKSWEGRYWVAQDTHDVLRVSLTLSKNPKFVKEFAMEVGFQVLPEGPQIIKYTKMKLDAGMFIKRVRMVIEEEYQDFQIL